MDAAEVNTYKKRKEVYYSCAYKNSILSDGLKTRTLFSIFLYFHKFRLGRHNAQIETSFSQILAFTHGKFNTGRAPAHRTILSLRIISLITLNAILMLVKRTFIAVLCKSSPLLNTFGPRHLQTNLSARFSARRKRKTRMVQQNV